MSTFSIIFWSIIGVTILYGLLDYISVKSTSQWFKWLRVLYWPSKKRKILSAVSPLIAFPLAIEMDLGKNNTFKDAYTNHGTDALIDAVMKYSDEKTAAIVEAIRNPKPVDWRSETTKKYSKLGSRLDDSEHSFIDNYENQNK